jgi:hypothetical protein
MTKAAGGRMAASYLETLGFNFRQSQLLLLGFVIVLQLFQATSMTILYL